MNTENILNEINQVLDEHNKTKEKFEKDYLKVMKEILSSDEIYDGHTLTEMLSNVKYYLGLHYDDDSFFHVEDENHYCGTPKQQWNKEVRLLKNFIKKYEPLMTSSKL